MKEYAPKIKKMALLCSILKKGGLEAFLRLLEALLRQALLLLFCPIDSSD